MFAQDLSDIFAPDGPLAKTVDGYHPRQAQLELALVKRQLQHFSLDKWPAAFASAIDQHAMPLLPRPPGEDESVTVSGRKGLKLEHQSGFGKVKTVNGCVGSTNIAMADT